MHENYNDVILHLIGETRPYGDTHVDGERLKNLQNLTQLMEVLTNKLILISKDKYRSEYSMQNMGQVANVALVEMRDTLNEYLGIK